MPTPQSDQTNRAKPSLNLLTDDESQRIYFAALEVLSRTGAEILQEEARSLLEEAGAHLEGERAYLPSFLVKEALNKAPNSVLIYDREGNPAMRLGGSNSYFGTGSDCPNIIDSFTGKRRKFTKKDVEQGALLCDALPNIDFVMSMGLIKDRPTAVTDLHQFQAMLFNTKKPIVFTSHDVEGNEIIIDMASLAAGSKKKLQRKPFVIHYIEPTTPLRHSKDALEKLLLCSEVEIPIVYTAAPMAGASAPVTLAGALVISLAEYLTGVVISNLKREGTPMIMGGVTTNMDMKTTTILYGSPEFHLMSIALSEISRYLDLPMFGTAGCSDAKLLDEQAVIESTISCATQALSGANLIHDVGYLESGLTGSFDMVVATNEIIGMVQRVLEGVNMEENHIATNLIEQVGPKGDYLTQSHTAKLFKSEHWEPQLLDREDYETWLNNGSKSFEERVNEKVRNILDKHHPEPLDESKREDILQLLKESTLERTKKEVK